MSSRSSRSLPPASPAEARGGVPLSPVAAGAFADFQASVPGAATLSPRQQLSRRVAAHLAAWLLVSVPYAGMLVASAVRAGAIPQYRGVAVEAVAALLPWAACSLGMHHALGRRPGNWRPRYLLAVFAAAFVLFQVPQLYYQQLVTALRGGTAMPLFPEVYWSVPPFFWLSDLTLLLGTQFSVLAWVAFWHNHQLQRDQRVAESALAAMRLQLEEQRLGLLQAQLEPHFLFNALNAIAGLVRARAEGEALSAISRLSELLRYALRSTRRTWTTLGDECEFIRGYLSLQGLRFGERLRTEWELSAEALDFPCPPLLLQPLVENAVHHGIETMAGPGCIRIRAWVAGRMLHVRIGNPRQAVEPRPGFGIGLASVRERLALLYAGGAQLEARGDDHGFEVELRLPEPADD